MTIDSIGLAELAEVGGNKDRAKIGTNLHGVAERRLRDGEQPAVIEAALWLDNYVESLRIAGIEIDPNYLEVIVVRDGDRIAGKVDYLRVTVPGYPLPMIGDLKTGDTLDYSLRGYVIQLAGYRFADSIYVQGAADDGSDDERRPLPELDEHRGLIIHAPAGGGPVAFHVVDLDAGREALQLALAVEAWRKRTDLAVELDNGQLAAQLQASLDAINKPSKSVAGRTGVARPPAEGRCAPQDEPGLPRSASGLERPPQRQRATNGAELRAWLQGRINVIGRHEAARSSLQRRWPAGVAPLARQEMHTDDELAEIERCLDRVEAMHSIPFGPNRPYAEQAALGWITSAFPGSTVMDEPNSPTNTHTQEQTS